MSIKAQHTVVRGDRITRIAANYQVSTEAIVQANPSIFTPDRLARSAALVAAGTLNPGELLFYPGEILNIPMGRVDEIALSQTVEADNDDELTIFIDNKKCPLPHTFEFTEYFDACSDSFSLVYPHDPELENPVYRVNPADFITKGLPAIKIYIGNEPVLTGSIEVPGNKITQNSSSQTLSGRSGTLLLEKSDPLPGLQREFVNLNLQEIASLVCSSFSIRVIVSDNVDIGDAFAKATIEDNEKPYTFLGRLARERSAIVGKTGLGECLITKFDQSQAVAYFDIDADFLRFIGVESLEFVYDTTKLFGQYIGRSQDSEDSNIEGQTASKAIIQNSVQIISYQDATAATIDNMVEWEEQKAIREFYNNEIPFPSWINPNNGRRWRAGEVIAIRSSEAGIPEAEFFMIRFVRFEKSVDDQRTALLNLVPVSVYA